jgi:antitoxin MazE
MRQRLIKIGNSRGLRLPKALIEQVGFGQEVEVSVRKRSILIEPAVPARTGWAEAARRLGPSSGLLDAGTSTRFDENEWHW